MVINKFKRLTADAEVCGQLRQIEWEEGDGVLAISGIRSFVELSEVLDRLTSGGVSLMRMPPPLDASKMSPEEFKAYAEREYGYIVTRPEPPAHEMPPITAPVQVKIKMPDVDPDRTAKAVIDALADAFPTKKDAAPATIPADLGDVAALGRMTRLGEVVQELNRRGHTTYEAILAECQRLAAIGDVCPPLDVLVANKQLEERLKNHLTGKGIAVPS